jgi:hypothetical protein
MGQLPACSELWGYENVAGLKGMRDPYALLAVRLSATPDDIKKSFRLLAKKLHPDANKNDPKAAALFAEIKAAYDILGDEAKRKAYDRGKIDAEGNPAPETVANAISSLTLSVTGLMVAIAIFVTSQLIMRNLPPVMGNYVNSTGGAPRTGGGVSQERALAERFWFDSRLLFPQSISYVGPDTIPLGIQVDGETLGLALEISGLPSGATISKGRAIPGGGWRILAADVRNAMIYLPAGFSGEINLAVELRLFDDTVVDRGSLRLKWLQTKPIESANATPATESTANKASATAAPTDQNAIQSATNSHRDNEPIELLIGRSEKLISEGNVEAARILLQPAAEAQDARAALALGATYDPIMLAILQPHGVASDLSLALDWYKKARDYGSLEAEQRLRSLTAAFVEPKKPVVRPPIHVVVSHVVAPRAAQRPHHPIGVHVAGAAGADPELLNLPPDFIQ